MLPFGDYYKGFFQVGETGAGAFWEIRPKSLYKASHEETIKDMVQNVLPENSFLQIGIMADPRIGGILSQWRMLVVVPK